MSIVSSINTNVGKACSYTAKHWFSKSFEKAAKDPAKYAASMLVTSIVSKDAVGCVLYTTQSWNNEKIPENKRKFVAMTDLVNGVIMVGGQFAIGKLIERKFAPNIIGKNITGTFKDKDTSIETELSDKKSLNAPLSDRKIYENYIKTCKKHGDELKKLGVDLSDPKKFREIGEQVIKKYGKGSKEGKAIIAGCGLLITALATNAFVKRTVAPLMSTPIAGWIKDKYVDKPHSGHKHDAKTEAKADKKPEAKPNSDDVLLDHSTAPWNYAQSNKSDKAVFNKFTSK